MKAARLFLVRFSKAVKLFDERRCLTLAAASSFYVIITMVPLALLLLRLVGTFLGDMGQTERLFFEFLPKAFPQATPEIVGLLRKIISGPLFGAGGMTLFNLGVLTFTSLGLVNSLWNGIFLITEDPKLKSWKNYLLGVAILLMTAALLLALFALPPAILFVINLLLSNEIMSYLSETIPNFHVVHSWLLTLGKWAGLLVRSYFFYAVILVSYFTILYRWLFHQSLALRGAVLAAVTFVSGLIIGKGAFAYYFSYARHNLERQYGSYYSFIAALMWVLAVMALFYFGLCLGHVYRQTGKDDLVIFRRRVRRFFKLFFK